MRGYKINITTEDNHPMCEVNIDDINVANLSELSKQIRQYQKDNNLPVNCPVIRNGYLLKDSVFQTIDDRYNNPNGEYTLDDKTYHNLDFIGFPDYAMCKEDASVYRIQHGDYKLIKPNVIRNKNTPITYDSYMLYFNRQRKGFMRHKLFAMCFVPNPNQYRFVTAVDGNSRNLTTDNIIWCEKHNNGRGK